MPFLIICAPAWWWIDLANVLLGANQALAWSMTVIMKIDLVGPRRRGLALGLNEFAGYFAVGVMSWVTGHIAAHYGLRPQPFYLGIAISVVGLLMSLFLIRDARLPEARNGSGDRHGSRPIARTDLLRDQRRQSEPLRRLPGRTGQQPQRWDVLESLPPVLQRPRPRRRADRGDQGGLSGHVGPAPDRDRDAVGPGGSQGLIAWGMVVQAGGIWPTVLVPAYGAWLVGAILQGLGTAMVYPALLAAIVDHAHPTWRASSLGVYRFWRDLGYAIGALLSGLVADFAASAPRSTSWPS